jgi:small subunit ribosomal protein S5
MVDNRRKPKRRMKREKPEFDQQIVDLARVTRVTKGGKQLSFRVCIVIGDRKGRVGYGIDKGKDVQIAVEKAVRKAKKNLFTIPILKGTIPHRIEAKFKAAQIMMKPAPQGSGIIAGSVVRVALELAGVPNISAKMIGRTTNKLTNIQAVFAAFGKLKVKAAPLKKRILPKKEEKVAPKKEQKAAPKVAASKKA